MQDSGFCRCATLAFFALSAAFLSSQVRTQAPSLVPQPRSMRIEAEGRIAGARFAMVALESQAAGRVLIGALRALGAKRILRAKGSEEATLVFARDAALAAEEYAVDCEQALLRVRASSREGFARAAASLLQLARVDEDGRVTWPRCTLRDAPSFGFRAFMVDMGRNPHRKATLMRIVDAMWLFKLRYLQLHLIDDQLSSWPSEAFPKLRQERAGWTLDDYRALEAYASARGITIIPEIEVPGHSTILRREYPEVFGKNPTELARSPEAQRGVETLIRECLEVFRSSPYVHVGGDEAYGVPQDLQRDFINRLNRFVRSLGKRTIVWEGPRLGVGENKIATDVLHMNWRTIDVPAQEMLDAGYEVVNACWDPFYIVDHYPKTMFTAIDLERIYAWQPRRFAHVNPGMRTYKKPHETKTTTGIVGFCMPWWEGRDENVLPLCVPRMAAAGAAAWNRPGEASFASFLERYASARALAGRAKLFELPTMPFATEESQRGNLAFRAKVSVSSGASQPHFGPQRLTNGIAERFDHFLGYKTKPEPLEIVVDLGRAQRLARIVVHETAVRKSHELYELLISEDGERYVSVGKTDPKSRGKASFVEHRLPEPRAVRYIKLRTRGCHGLTFPSFSRLTEIRAFGPAK